MPIAPFPEPIDVAVALPPPTVVETPIEVALRVANELEVAEEDDEAVPLAELPPPAALPLAVLV